MHLLYLIDMYMYMASRCRAFSASSLSLFVTVLVLGALSFLNRLLRELEVEVDFKDDVSECIDFSDVKDMVIWVGKLRIATKRAEILTCGYMKLLGSALVVIASIDCAGVFGLGSYPKPLGSTPFFIHLSPSIPKRQSSGRTEYRHCSCKNIGVGAKRERGLKNGPTLNLSQPPLLRQLNPLLPTIPALLYWIGLIAQTTTRLTHLFVCMLWTCGTSVLIDMRRA